MSSIQVALWIVALIVALAVVPATYVLTREAWLRYATRRARNRLDRALATLDPVTATKMPDVRMLLRRFDDLTVERAIETMLRDAAARAWGLRLFRELGLAPRYAARTREARRWSERAHAAEILGLVASSDAVPALVAALRDPHEDLGSVKLAAAEALARMKNADAVPLLVTELRVVDEHASPRVADALVGFGSIAVEPLLALLGEAEPGAARVWAARVLGRIGDPAATDGLVSRLADRNDLLRGAAVEALGNVGDRRALQPVIQATLRDPAPQVRAHAAAAASKIAGAGAVDVLTAALADPDYGTRLRALEAFEHIEVRDTTALERALSDVNLEVRRRAALALERVGYLSRVVDDLASADADKAARAYRELLRLGSAGLVDSVAGYLYHAQFEVRAQAAMALGELGQARVGPLLLAALDDAEWPVRAALVRAIGQLRVPDAPAALTKLLADPNEIVREGAMQALAEYAAVDLAGYWPTIAAAYDPGTVPVRWHAVDIASRMEEPSALELLVRASRDASERTRTRAVTALAGREGAVPVLVERLSDPALEVRMAAVAALGSAATEAAFEGLVGALGGASPDARERIAQALAKSAQGTLLERLISLADSGSLDVRIGIAWTLGKSGDPAAVPALVKLLRDGDARVRASAAGALGKIPVPSSASALRAAAPDRDTRTRAAVVNALGKTAKRGDGTHEVLAKRLEDPDAFVRDRAAIALARLGEEGAWKLVDHAMTRGRISDAAALFAASLSPSEEALDRLAGGVADPERFARLRTFAGREELALREVLHARLHLDPPTADGPPPDAAALVLHYERLLAESQDAAGRLVALDFLARIAHDRGIELLGDALAADPVEEVRLRAARALAKRSAAPLARRALVRAVADPDAGVALVCIRALGEAREASASSALFERVAASAGDLDEALCDALASIHRDDPTPFLDRMMGEDRPTAIAAGARVLERIGDPATLPLLASLARSESAVVRTSVVHALAAFPGKESSELIDDALDDPSEDVRLAALASLARAKSDAGLARLAAAARSDPSASVRARIAVLATPFEQLTALRLLESLAEDPKASVRAAAIASLLDRGDATSLASFVTIWPKAAPGTRHELRADTRAPAIVDRLAGVLAARAETADRTAAISGIAALAPPRWFEQLVVALRDPDVDVRIAAIRALASAVDDGVRARIFELLADPDERVRAAARKAQMRVVG